MKTKLLSLAAALSILVTVLVPAGVSALGETIIIEAEDYTSTVNDGVWDYGSNNNELNETFSGDGYIRTYGANELTYEVNVPQAGEYRILIYGALNASDPTKWDSFYVNGTEYYAHFPAGSPAWTASELKAFIDNGFVTQTVNLPAGLNTFRLDVHKWGSGGYIYYDKIELIPLPPPILETDEIIAGINALPDTLELTHEDTILELWGRYEALNEAEKALITNIAKLEAAAELIERLRVTPVIMPENQNGNYAYAPLEGIINGGAVRSEFEAQDAVSLPKGSAYVRMPIHVPAQGRYQLYVYTAYADGNDFSGKVTVDDIGALYIASYSRDTWTLSPIGSENYVDSKLSPAVPADGFLLSEGTHTVTIQNNWGAGWIGDLILVPVTDQTADLEDVKALIAALPDEVSSKNANEVNAAFEGYLALSDEDITEITAQEKQKLFLAKARIDAIASGDTEAGALRYELEYGNLSGIAAAVDGASGEFPSYGGSGYVYLFEPPDSISLDFYVPVDGNYRIYLVSGSTSADAKCEEVRINGGEVLYAATPGNNPNKWHIAQPGAENWVNGILVPKAPERGIALNKGQNHIVISANWGYAAYDAIIVKPFTQVNQSVVQALIEQISNLPDAPALSDSGAVDAAYIAYLTLTDAEKDQITNASKLFTVRALLQAEKSGGGLPAGTLRYEWEDALLHGNTSVVTEKTAFDNYSGSGYVFLFDSKMALDIWVKEAGQYRIYVVSGTTEDNNKCDFFSLNGGQDLLVSTPKGKTGIWQTSQPGTENWENGVLKPKAPAGGFTLNAGRNTISLSANWGYAAYDSVLVVPYGSGEFTDSGINPPTGSREAMPALLLGVICSALSIILLSRKKRKCHA